MNDESPRRDDRAYDDNRDNRMPETAHDKAGQKDQAKDASKERGPSMIAYTVKDRGQDHDAVWRSAARPSRTAMARAWMWFWMPCRPMGA